MNLRPYPNEIYIFDINGTLNFEHMNMSQVPAKLAFESLKKRRDVWVGTWSGMYRWMQLQLLHDYGITPDFVLRKSDGNIFKKQLEHIYEKPFDSVVYCVGDQEEDIEYADKYGFIYLKPHELTNKIINERHIPRPVIAGEDRKGIQRHRTNLGKHKRMPRRQNRH